MFKDKTILITGAGSLGTELVKQLLEKDVHAVRVFDNSEQALFKLQLKFPEEKRIRYILGDVANPAKINFACRNVDYVVHTAARKFVNYAEQNPDVFIETNIHGTENIIQGCIKNKVEKSVFISSDKALHEHGIYANTKMIGESLYRWAHRISDITKFTTIRMPNFNPSDGSIFEIFPETMRKEGCIYLTDKRMKRYFMPLKEVAEFVLFVLSVMQGGEIFIPKAQEYLIYDLALQYAGGDESCIKEIGIREGEVLEEKLISESEIKIAVDKGGYWIIPSGDFHVNQ